MRYATFTVLIVLSAAAYLMVSLWSDESKPVESQGAPLLLLSVRRPQDVAHLPEIKASSQVTSLSELQDALELDGASLVIVDGDFAKQLAPGSLAEFANTGSAILGIDVPLDRLMELTSFQDSVASLNPRFRDISGEPATFSGQFFTIVWRTPAGANPSYWGATQQDLRAGIFATIVDDYRLRVKGLIREEGTIVPLEKYGQ